LLVVLVHRSSFLVVVVVVVVVVVLVLLLLIMLLPILLLLPISCSSCLSSYFSCPSFYFCSRTPTSAAAAPARAHFSPPHPSSCPLGLLSSLAHSSAPIVLCQNKAYWS
jgi:hypothetical protein